MKRLIVAAAGAALLATVTAAYAHPTPPVPVPPKVIVGGGGGNVPWALFACPTSIVVTAFVVNAAQNRPLTAAEAWTCGVGAWFAQAPALPPRQVVISPKG